MLTEMQSRKTSLQDEMDGNLCPDRRLSYSARRIHHDGDTVLRASEVNGTFSFVRNRSGLVRLQVRLFELKQA